MIEGLGRAGALQPDRNDGNAKKPGSSFVEWLESEAKAAERQALEQRGEFQEFGAEVAFDFHFRRGPQADEIVSVPWRLRSSGRLSQHPSTFAIADAMPLAGAMPQLALTARQAQMAPPVPAAPAAIATQIVSMQESLLPRAEPEVRRATANAAGADPLAPSRTADATAWAERLLRWLEREGRDPEAWIRDYALDDRAAERVADAMRGLAQERGVRLERIVVNGRELWRAPHANKENV